MRVQELGSEAALALWPEMEGYIAAALAHDLANELSLEDVRRQIESSYCTALLIGDGETVVAVTLVQCFMLRGRRVLHVLATAGERMDEWLDDLIPFLREMAQRQGATGVTMAGRPGWTRQLLQYGFKTERVTMRMEVENGRLREERIEQPEQQPEPGLSTVVRGPQPGALPERTSDSGAVAGDAAVGADSARGAGAQ